MPTAAHRLKNSANFPEAIELPYLRSRIEGTGVVLDGTDDHVFIWQAFSQPNDTRAENNAEGILRAASAASWSGVDGFEIVFILEADSGNDALTGAAAKMGLFDVGQDPLVGDGQLCVGIDFENNHLVVGYGEYVATPATNSRYILGRFVITSEQMTAIQSGATELRAGVNIDTSSGANCRAYASIDGVDLAFETSGTDNNYVRGGGQNGLATNFDPSVNRFSTTRNSIGSLFRLGMFKNGPQSWKSEDWNPGSAAGRFFKGRIDYFGIRDRTPSTPIEDRHFSHEILFNSGEAIDRRTDIHTIGSVTALEVVGGTLRKDASHPNAFVRHSDGVVSGKAGDCGDARELVFEVDLITGDASVPAQIALAAGQTKTRGRPCNILNRGDSQETVYGSGFEAVPRITSELGKEFGWAGSGFVDFGMGESSIRGDGWAWFPDVGSLTGSQDSDIASGPNPYANADNTLVPTVVPRGTKNSADSGTDRPMVTGFAAIGHADAIGDSFGELTGDTQLVLITRAGGNNDLRLRSVPVTSPTHNDGSTNQFTAATEGDAIELDVSLEAVESNAQFERIEQTISRVVGKPYPGVKIDYGTSESSEADELIEIVAAQWLVLESDGLPPVGVTFTSWSGGGLTAQDHVDAANDDDLLDIGRFDVAVFSLGDNDCASVHSCLARFRANLKTLIQRHRAKNSQLLVVLQSSHPRDGWVSSEGQTNAWVPFAMHNLVVLELESLALELGDGVCAVNTRRGCHAAGWVPRTRNTQNSDTAETTTPAGNTISEPSAFTDTGGAYDPSHPETELAARTYATSFVGPIARAALTSFGGAYRGRGRRRIRATAASEYLG